MFRYSSLNPGDGSHDPRPPPPAPRTLALMHGPSYSGDGAGALRALADDYDRRVRQMTGCSDGRSRMIPPATA